MLWPATVDLPSDKSARCLENGSSKGEETAAAKDRKGMRDRYKAIHTGHCNSHGIKKGIDNRQQCKRHQAIGAPCRDVTQLLLLPTASKKLPKLVLKQTYPKEGGKEIVGCTKGITFPTSSKGSNRKAKNTDAGEAQPLNRILVEVCPWRQRVHAKHTWNVYPVLRAVQHRRIRNLLQASWHKCSFSDSGSSKRKTIWQFDAVKGPLWAS